MVFTIELFTTYFHELPIPNILFNLNIKNMRNISFFICLHVKNLKDFFERKCRCFFIEVFHTINRNMKSKLFKTLLCFEFLNNFLAEDVKCCQIDEETSVIGRYILTIFFVYRDNNSYWKAWQLEIVYLLTTK